MFFIGNYIVYMSTIVDVVTCIGMLLFNIGITKKKKSLALTASIVNIIAYLVNLFYYIYHFGGTIKMFSSKVLPFIVWTISLVIALKSFKGTTLNGNLQSQTNNIDPLNTFDDVNKLNEYKELLDMGAISQEEFDTKKKEILNL